MKIINENGTILESDNKLVIEQWKKKGYKEYKPKKSEVTNNSDENKDTAKE